MFILMKLLLILFLCQYLEAKNFDHYDEDIRRNTPQLIESRKFKSETHYVTTSDGYILTIFRIINPYLSQRMISNNLKSIVLQHGFTGNSDMFLINSLGEISENGIYSEDNNTLITDCENFRTVGNTIGFVLSACGYDVWLANSRGNSYSTNHTTLQTDDKKFWSFTIDEFSLIDLPEIIRYVQLTTDKAKIGFIGHSMGTTIMFALMSTNGYYSQIIEPFIALAPVVFTSKIQNVLTKLKFMHPLLRAFPMPLIRFAFLKKLIIELFGGHEIPENKSYLKEIVAHLIDESSTLVLSHYFQMMEHNNFAKYDYGIIENLRLYNTWKAPEYSLKNICSPNIALFQAEDDSLADVEDINRLKKELKVKLLVDYWIPDKSWTHLDFATNENSGKYFMTETLKLLALNQNSDS